MVKINLNTDYMAADFDPYEALDQLSSSIVSLEKLTYNNIPDIPTDEVSLSVLVEASEAYGLNIDKEYIKELVISNEGFFSAIGNIIGAIFKGIWKIIMGLLEFIGKMLKAIVDFITAPFRSKSSGGGVGSVGSSIAESKKSDVKKTLKEEIKKTEEKVDRNVKEMLEKGKDVSFIKQSLIGEIKKYVDIIKDKKKEICFFYTNEIGEITGIIKTEKEIMYSFKIDRERIDIGNELEVYLDKNFKTYIEYIDDFNKTYYGVINKNLVVDLVTAYKNDYVNEDTGNGGGIVDTDKLSEILSYFTDLQKSLTKLDPFTGKITTFEFNTIKKKIDFNISYPIIDNSLISCVSMIVGSIEYLKDNDLNKNQNGLNMILQNLNEFNSQMENLRRFKIDNQTVNKKLLDTPKWFECFSNLESALNEGNTEVRSNCMATISTLSKSLEDFKNTNIEDNLDKISKNLKTYEKNNEKYLEDIKNTTKKTKKLLETIDKVRIVPSTTNRYPRLSKKDFETLITQLELVYYKTYLVVLNYKTQILKLLSIILKEVKLDIECSHKSYEHLFETSVGVVAVLNNDIWKR